MPNTSADSVFIDLVRSVVETLPLSARTVQNTNSPSFHVVKLPLPDGELDRFRRVVAEYCIQPLGGYQHQAIWWTCYIVLARRGTLSKGTGVYTEWNEFGTVSSSHPETGLMAPRNTGIVIADISKGVLNGNHTNGTVLRVVDLGEVPTNVEVFAVLVASGMHDGSYQVHGQARLEYRIRDN